MPSFQVEQLRHLPQHADEVWQGALIRMPAWVAEPGAKSYRPWAMLWMSVKSGYLFPTELCRPGEPLPAKMWELLVRCASDADLAGYRPVRIEVCDAALDEHLRPSLTAAGIELVCRETLPQLDKVAREPAESMSEGPKPAGCFSGAGVTHEHMRQFAHAAQAFYEAAPWQHLSDEDLIAIEAPRAPRGMRYATVLGHAGQAFGIGFHRTAEACWDIHRDDDEEHWLMPGSGGVWSLTFGDITELPFEDADLWVDGQLPVADEAAHPCLAHFELVSGITRPDARRLTFVTRLLLALAGTREQQIDQGRWTLAVAAGRRKVNVTLALPDLLEPPDFQELIRRGFEPDRRAMERMHAQMNRFLADRSFEDVDAINAAIQAEFNGKPFDPAQHPPRTPLEQAQDLCHQAFEARGRRQIQLARQALALTGDCADAYVILAEHCSEPEEAAKLYARGVAAGQRALGEQRFKDDAGHFWHQHDTRPYLRARLGLAHCLEAQGRVEEAVEHYRAMLQLNPGDNQGVRYLYLPRLLELGRDAEAARFMKQSEDEPTANWTWTRALLAFRLGGDTASTRTELAKAIEANPHVIELLIHDAAPDELPAGYALGSMEEAILCVHELGRAWRATPAAVDWLVMYQEMQSPQRPRIYKQRKRRSR